MRLLNLKNFLWKLMKKVSNLNFALGLLFIISFFSIFGSIIEQNQSIDFYKLKYPMSNAKISLFNWKFISLLGLDHVYQSWLFLFIIFLFFLSLCSCTFTIQLPSLKYARRWKFITNRQKKMNKDNLAYQFISSNTITRNSFINLVYSLNNSSFYVFHKSRSIYAYRGLIGRLAPIFVHISIFIIIIGSVLSIFSSFMVQEMIAEGEIFHFKNIINSGLFSTFPSNFVARIEQFNVSYNEDRSIRQFFSNINIIDNKANVILNKTISVNTPLFYKGLTFYQTDWQIDALRFKIENSINFEKKLQKIDLNNRKVWLCTLTLDSDNQYLFIFFSYIDPIYIYDQKMNYIMSTVLNKNIYLSNINLKITDILVSTGLQVKADPGVNIVYIGFFGIMCSTIASYVSYAQIWVYNKANDFSISGATNRAILFFEEDINQINQIYQKYTL